MPRWSKPRRRSAHDGRHRQCRRTEQTGIRWRGTRKRNASVSNQSMLWPFAGRRTSIPRKGIWSAALRYRRAPRRSASRTASSSGSAANRSSDRCHRAKARAAARHPGGPGSWATSTGGGLRRRAKPMVTAEASPSSSNATARSRTRAPRDGSTVGAATIRRTDDETAQTRPPSVGVRTEALMTPAPRPSFWPRRSFIRMGLSP